MAQLMPSFDLVFKRRNCGSSTNVVAAPSLRGVVRSGQCHGAITESARRLQDIVYVIDHFTPRPNSSPECCCLSSLGRRAGLRFRRSCQPSAKFDPALGSCGPRDQRILFQSRIPLDQSGKLRCPNRVQIDMLSS